MKELTICSICLEPVMNFICIDCLASQIKKVIPNSFLDEFNSFHLAIVKKFENTENIEFCIGCKQFKETAICPYCYVKEVFFWILDKDRKIAKKVVKIFNFDFLETGYEEDIRVKNWEPLILSEKEEEVDLNACEICGQVAELTEKNNLLVCESCKDEI